MDEWVTKFWLANILSVTPLWLLYYGGQACHFPHSLTAEWERLVLEWVETVKGKPVGWREIWKEGIATPFCCLWRWILNVEMKQVKLTFKNIHNEIKLPISQQKLPLLKPAKLSGSYTRMNASLGKMLLSPSSFPQKGVTFPTLLLK